jgi:hypothetical protein
LRLRVLAARETSAGTAEFTRFQPRTEWRAAHVLWWPNSGASSGPEKMTGLLREIGKEQGLLAWFQLIFFLISGHYE